VSVMLRPLRPYEGKKLHRMKNQRSNAVNARHARAILLARGRVPNSRIAVLCDYSPTWVRVLIHRFNDGGIDAVSWFPYLCSPAEPRKFVADVAEQIAQVALSPPSVLIGLSVLSLQKLREYLIDQGIVEGISLEWLRQILRRRRVRWRHTKTWKESTDPQFWPKYRRIRRLYGRRQGAGVRLCVDEFGPLNLQPRHGRHWARTGHVDRHRATYHRTGGVRYWMAVYDLDGDTLTGRFVRRKNGRTFLAFLKWLRDRYDRSLTLHVVLDNIGYHGTPQVRQWAAANKIRFYKTPTGASWLNRIESHLTAVRKFALDNTDYRSHPQMQAAINRYVDWRNGHRPITLQPWDVYQRSHAKVA